jgi:hypothetical protein
MMYIDSLWNYYNGGDFTLTDEQYDRLRDELNWQGSGFPTLRRYEVQFVEAAISYARGEAKVTDQEYEELKRKVRAAGKRDDVTALLLYTKGQQLLEPAQFEQLRDEMAKLSIDVGLRGATCTLSNTSTDLIADSGTVTKMYTALAIVPSLIGIVPYLGASIFGVDVPPAAGLGFAATIALGLDLHDCQLHQPAERDRRDWPVPLLRGAHQAVLRRRGARDEHGLQVPGVRHPVQAGPRRDEDQRVGWIIGELIKLYAASSDE